jgi:LPXTG-motif cell wall-anchored protein
MNASHKLRSGFNSKNVLISMFAVATIAAIGAFLSMRADAAQPTVGLGSATSFAVLAGSGITNTGATTVGGTAGGDLGSSPTATFTGEVLVTTSGTKYTAASAAVDSAKTDLVVAYNDAVGRTPAITIAGDLGGQTLVPGVYNSASTVGLTGTLTLNGEGDPNAVFIFQAGSTLTTAGSSQVVMTNGAQACNVFWQVGSSATLGTNSTFVGHILALTSITATTGATIQGSLLARNGAVTLDSNTITNDSCVLATATPTASPTATPTATPTEEPTVEPTATPTEEPTVIAPAPEETTEAGGELPDTDANNWILPFGIAVVLVGAGVLAVVYRRRNG